MPLESMPLESKVAQLLMVGFTGSRPNPITQRFLEAGVGGIIFFRDNFQHLAHPHDVRQLLSEVTATIPPHAPAPLLGIDQEGGQVERLPHFLFPTALSPMAVALSREPEKLARQMYAMMASHLAQLGFNLNFFPTLDVNLNPQNPIIGVRAFGEDPEMVWRFAHIAMQAYQQVGIIPVGKHFPGHGNGTVDSHLDLPVLHFTETELRPFQHAVQAGLPAMLIAHGLYPELQSDPAEHQLPSSASPTIIKGLLRKQLGFSGVTITDDMCMGAITQHGGPVEAAKKALKAGIDLLLYKQSTESEWEIYEALVAAYQKGELSVEALNASVQRILHLKASLQTTTGSAPLNWQAETLADTIAVQGLRLLSGKSNLLPLSPNTRLLLVHPERNTMGNYAFDVPTSPDLPTCFQATGFTQIYSLPYAIQEPHRLPDALDQPECIVFVSFNAHLHAAQQALYQNICTRFSDIPIMLVSAGTPYESAVLTGWAAHLSLCSYRPASMRALPKMLLTQLQ